VESGHPPGTAPVRRSLRSRSGGALRARAVHGVGPPPALPREILGEAVLSPLTSLPAATALAATQAVVSGVVGSGARSRKELRAGRPGVVGERWGRSVGIGGPPLSGERDSAQRRQVGAIVVGLLGPVNAALETGMSWQGGDARPCRQAPAPVPRLLCEHRTAELPRCAACHRAMVCLTDLSWSPRHTVANVLPWHARRVESGNQAFGVDRPGARSVKHAP
jgi:hypothetical protein